MNHSFLARAAVVLALAVSWATGAAGKKAVGAAIAAVRQHQEVTARAIERARLELDAAALLLP